MNISARKSTRCRSSLSIPSCSIGHKGDSLCLNWEDDSRVIHLSATWLRDNSPDSMDNVSHGRKFLMSDLKQAVKIVKLTCNGTGVELTLSDGHISFYTFEWLQDRIEHENHSNRKSLAAVELWGADHIIRMHSFDQITSDPKFLLSWLQDLVKFGITVVRNVPCTTDGLRTLQRHVGIAKRTHYGDYFQVKTKNEANNLAYTGAGLGLHTDLPFYRYTPGRL